MEKSYSVSNTEKLISLMPENSVAFLMSGHTISYSDSCEYDFEVNRDFYYLTGIDKEDLYFAVVKTQRENECALFIPRVSEHDEKWFGRNLRIDEAKELCAADKVLYLDEMEDYIFSLVDRGLINEMLMITDNVPFGNAPTQNNMLKKEYEARYPRLKFSSLEELIHPLRYTKSELELQTMKNAVNITASALVCVLKNLTMRETEYDVQADYEYIVKRRNSAVSFASIVAGGNNATCLHYRDNNCELDKNGLVLLDVGAQSEKYCSDITRTFPVSGKFTPRQKQLYEIVLEVNKRVIEAIRPGVMLRSLNKVVTDFYEEKLVEIGLCQTPEEVSNYYYHGVSHMLGLEVHDVSAYDVKLSEGMVITVEPGIYVADESIGIRIEDDVVVTAYGCKVLSDNIPKEVADIEKLAGREE